MKYILTVYATLLFNVFAFSQVFVNSYSKSKITDKGIFGGDEKFKEIHLTFPSADILKTSIKNGNYVTAVAKDVSLVPFNNSSAFSIGENVIVKYKIVAQNARTIRITFDKLFLPPNAELYLYNADGTMITGPITEKENIGDGKVNKYWSSNTFQGNTLVLELKVPQNDLQKVVLNISKVFFGLEQSSSNNSDSTELGSFNASSSCNINVLCSQGNAWATERKAVCLIEFSSGAYLYDASGALINNACNFLIPYVLTAYHVEHGFNPSSFTFLFNWWSSTCTTNTNTSQSILFNGATFKAEYLPTDMGLLQLNQTPTSTLNLSFLGWDRTGTVPTSEVGIHHPRADQMKISFDTNPAYVGDIQGYTNTGWRLLWTSGAVENGSSGSPLFNQNHSVIGQLYSNTTPAGPPCNQQTGGTNSGRFDLSWTGGGTSASRLSDWLDPNRTGATTVTSINISSALPPGLSFSSTNNYTVCSASTTNFAVNSYCGAVSYTYVLSGVSTAYAKFSNGTQTITSTSTSIPITFSTLNSIATLSVTANFSDNTSSSAISNKIVIGKPVPIIQSVTQNGADVGLTALFIPYASYNWYENQLLIETGDGNTYQTGVGCGQTKFVQTEAVNTCGTSTKAGRGISNTNCKGNAVNTITLLPNPADGKVMISLDNHDTKKSQSTSAIQLIRIVDKTGNLISTVHYATKQNQVTLSTSVLKPDIYIIQIYDGNNWYYKQLLVKH